MIDIAFIYSYFLPHNAHRISPAAFRELDPHLRRLAEQPLVFRSRLLDLLPKSEPGIYTLGGARQIGKTTLLKQWVELLLDRGVPGTAVAYFTGEVIDDHHSLLRVLHEELAEPCAGVRFLLIDEVTCIRGWDRALKFLSDSGALEHTIVMTTGSDLTMVAQARRLLPGRRGAAAAPDYHLFPLTHLETCQLKRTLPPAAQTALASGSVAALDALGDQSLAAVESSFEEYLVHGGFLTAINDLAARGHIRPSTLATYSDWIRGDALTHGKREAYLREVLGALLARQGSQVTWNGLAPELSIDHPQTVAEYVQLLTAMDALVVQPALVEDRRTAAPKKARKVGFADPFIAHAVAAWLEPSLAADAAIRARLAVPGVRAALAETCAAAHARQHFPTYYIKARGEVDLAIVDAGRFWPIEVKWTRQLRPPDLKQIRAYADGVVAARTQRSHTLAGLRVVPLPLALSCLGRGIWPPPP